MGLLYGRAGRLTAENGGFRGQGALKAGALVEALEERANGYGVLRVRSGLGWVSVKSGAGAPILEEVDRFGRPIRAGSSRRFKAATEAITVNLRSALQHAKGKIHRVDPEFGSTFTVSNRDSQSNCWVN
jgi:hypothetical protein